MPAEDFGKDLLEVLPSLGRYAGGLTKSRVAADDLVQDTVLRALEKQHQFTPGTSLRSWLFTIMKRLWLDRLRKARDRGEILVDPHGAVTLMGADKITPERHALAREALGRVNGLRKHHQMVLECVAFGWTMAEMEEALDMPAGTVRSKIHRAREKLEKACE